MEFCKTVNGYLTEKEPWIIAKDASRMDEVREILYNTAESLRALAILLHPVMPSSCERLWSWIGGDSLGPITSMRIDQVAEWGQLKPGSEVTKGDALFPRLED
jgi:methionyl-tRNA synthetase